MIPVVEKARNLLGDGVGCFSNGEYRPGFAGVSPGVIVAAETHLGLHFPADYRDFLMACGSLLIGGQWIYGIVDADFEGNMLCDGVRSTRHARQVFDFPRHLFLLVDDEGDEYHCLDCSERAGGSVVVWDTHEQKVTQQLAGSFVAYLEDVVNRVLERKGF